MDWKLKCEQQKRKKNTFKISYYGRISQQDTESTITVDKSDYAEIKIVCSTENTINKMRSYVMGADICIRHKW